MWKPEFPARQFRDQLTISRLTAPELEHQLVKIGNTTAWSRKYSFIIETDFCVIIDYFQLFAFLGRFRLVRAL